jgi:hypothetical protein
MMRWWNSALYAFSPALLLSLSLSLSLSYAFLTNNQEILRKRRGKASRDYEGSGKEVLGAHTFTKKSNKP